MLKVVVAVRVTPERTAEALIVIDPAPVAVTAFEATPLDDVTVSGNPLTVPVPLAWVKVSE